MLHTCHWIRLYKQLNDKLQFLVKKPFWTFAPLAHSKEIKFPVRIQKIQSLLADWHTRLYYHIQVYGFMNIRRGVQTEGPNKAKEVGDISLGSRCVEQRALQFYNIINKQVNLYKGKWMLHSLIFPNTKNGSCDFVIYSYYKSNSIQNSHYFISKCNMQLVKQKQSFPSLQCKPTGGVGVQLHSLQTLAKDGGEWLI
jgi:hypothetical protein